MQANEQWESDEEFLARLAARRAKKKAEKLAVEEAAKPQQNAEGFVKDR
jgi:hypothetical protein